MTSARSTEGQIQVPIEQNADSKGTCRFISMQPPSRKRRFCSIDIGNKNRCLLVCLPPFLYTSIIVCVWPFCLSVVFSLSSCLSVYHSLLFTLCLCLIFLFYLFLYQSFDVRNLTILNNRVFIFI